MSTAPTCPPGRTDLVSDRRAYFLLWRLPWLAIAASLPLRGSSLMAGVWTTAFAQMGIACIANASACGRLHCYFTGPFYLLGAVASFLRGMGRLRISWPGLGAVMVVGWLVLSRLPEKLWGRYAGRPFGTASRFDRFTDRARGVLEQAQEEARGLDHHYIGTEHLLLGLIREDQGVAAKLLRDRGVELDRALAAVEQIVGRGDQTGSSSGAIGLTPRAKRVIELSVEEARRLRHSYVGTEHLLLGLVREDEGVAVGALRSLGVSTDLAAMRGQVTRLLREH
jgi:hypothetical protein